MNQLSSRWYDTCHRRATNKKHYSFRETFDAARITKKKKVSERTIDRSIGSTFKLPSMIVTMISSRLIVVTFSERNRWKYVLRFCFHFKKPKFRYTLMYTYMLIRMIRQIREGNIAIDACGIDRFFAVRPCFNFPKFRVFPLPFTDTLYQLSVLE